MGSSDMDAEIAQLLSHRDQNQARDVKSRQISLLKETLDIVRNASEVDRVDIEALEAVLRRAETVAERFDTGEDMEIVRRHCVQEMELCRAMSVAGFSDGEDCTGGRVLQRRLRDFDDLSDMSPCIISPRSGGGSRSRSNSDAGSTASDVIEPQTSPLPTSNAKSAPCVAKSK